MDYFSNLPAELFAEVIDNLVPCIGPYKALRLRTVNKRFNDAILYSIFDNPAINWYRDPGIYTDHYDFRQMTAPLSSRMLFAQIKRNPDRTHILSAICRAAKACALDEYGQQTYEQQLENTRTLCEAVAYHLRPTHIMAIYPCSCLPHTISPDLQNAFCATIFLGNISMIRTLLAKGADVNADNTYFSRPLQLAIIRGRLDIVQLLLDHGADANAIAASGKSWWPPAIRYYRETKTCYWSSDGSPLRVACLAGQDHIVHVLLQPRYEVATSGVEYEAAIMAATLSGHTHLVALLIEKTGQPLASKLRQNIFWEASYYGRESIVQLMIDNGMDVNARRSWRWFRHLTALQIAASRNRANVIRLLLNNGAQDQYISRPSGGTALLIAVDGGHEEAVQVLLDHGGDLNSQLHKEALQRAAIKGQTHMIQFLLRMGADFNAPYDPLLGTSINRPSPYDSDLTVGEMTLSMAVERDNEQAVRVLAKAGVRLRPAMFGQKGVMQAPISGIVETLLETGAVTTELLEYARTLDPPNRNRSMSAHEQKKWKTRDWYGKY
ncbi:ankyrin [Wilcoxina mikolae CBS 423.85]|nr:ankyrin [Wilcoxina mikolae CBS 423.85]